MPPSRASMRRSRPAACYQINYTAQLAGGCWGTQALFAARCGAPSRRLHDLPGRWRGAGAVGLAGLFFDWDGERILTRPMKGTAARGATPAQDAALARAMRASPRSGPRNVMIVDLLRNDLSRIAVAHSVRVPRLFHAEGSFPRCGR